MAAKPAGLGRGLGALIKDSTPVTPAATSGGSGASRLPVRLVRKSPWQPRHHFEPEALAELVASVTERGVLQPLLVRRVGHEYELIAGERRLRAAQEAGLADVPAIIMEVSDREALEIALVENLQRSDLNLIEEAEGYRLLGEKFQLTQEEIAQRVGKARPTITNALRLLDLPDGVKRLVAERRLTPGHAKALLGLDDAEEQGKLAQRAISEELSVRTLERIVARSKQPARKARTERSDLPESHVRYLVEQLHQRLGTPVRLIPCRTLAGGQKVKGSIEIDFFSGDELDRLLTLLGVSEQL